MDSVQFPLPSKFFVHVSKHTIYLVGVGQMFFSESASFKLQEQCIPVLDMTANAWGRSNWYF